MTKKEAEKEFLEDVLPLVKDLYEKDHIPDYPARSEAWNNFIDYLNKEGRVTDKQASSWVCPTCCNRK